MLWTAVVLYIGAIYSTVSVVPVVRKWLVERFGQEIYDYLFPVFIIIGLALVGRGVRTVWGTALARYFLRIAAVGALYAYYLIRLPYAVERVHLLEYGGLGVLLYIACRRKMPNLLSLPLALLLTYLAGLGDEAIQHAIPDRVAEIRDSIFNAISGLLGLLLYLFSRGRPQDNAPVQPAQVRVLIATAGVCAAATGFFLNFIHGFGYVHESCETGTFFSSFSGSDLERINGSAPFVSVREKRVYENEAQRHLFQRDFYFTNDFKAADGSFYRQIWRAAWENRILETGYGRFMAVHARDSAARYSGRFDKKVGRGLGAVTVVWTDDNRKWVEAQCGGPAGTYTSRVKSTIITSFTPQDLLFYEALVFLLLGWCWVVIPGKMQNRTGA